MATPTTLPATFVAGNVLTAAQMNNLRGAFRVLQVVYATKIDTFTTTSTTFTDVTGLSASITPSATSSLVLVIAHMYGGNTTNDAGTSTNLVRGSTNIGAGTTAGSRPAAFSSNFFSTGAAQGSLGGVWVDNPATTSATTYKIQVRSGSAGTATIGRTGDDTDSGNRARTSSALILMEISA